MSWAGAAAAGWVSARASPAGVRPWRCRAGSAAPARLGARTQRQGSAGPWHCREAPRRRAAAGWWRACAQPVSAHAAAGAAARGRPGVCVLAWAHRGCDLRHGRGDGCRCQHNAIQAILPWHSRDMFAMHISTQTSASQPGPQPPTNSVILGQRIGRGAGRRPGSTGGGTVRTAAGRRGLLRRAAHAVRRALRALQRGAWPSLHRSAVQLGAARNEGLLC